MAFQASWNSISYNGGGFNIFGDGSRYRVNWGDGTSDVVDEDRDSDGDGIADSASAFHFYGQDGNYDIAVFGVQSGLPPIRFKAFMHSSATGDLDIGGSRLSDMMTGGSGNDTFRGADGDDFLAGSEGHDKLTGGDGGDVLLGGTGDDVLLGGTGGDLLGGDVGDDRLYGGADNDFIYGDSGRDAMFGDDGDDYLDGGVGIDRLTGGAGADVFEFSPPRDADGNPVFSDPDRDTVVDYQQGLDHLSVDQWFGGGFDFLGTARFTGAGSEVRFTNVGGATQVFGDVDGDKVADFSVRIEGMFALTEADFVF